MAIKLEKFIKNSAGEKVERHTTSVNLELRHLDFLKKRNLNLSGIVRELLNQLMAEDEKKKSG